MKKAYRVSKKARKKQTVKVPAKNSKPYKLPKLAAMPILPAPKFTEPLVPKFKVTESLYGGYSAEFTIGVQGFKLQPVLSKVSANWYCKMLATAFKNLVESNQQNHKQNPLKDESKKKRNIKKR